MKRLLAYLLFLANTKPGWDRYSFYEMKSALLRRYAEYRGDDVQEIRHECWDCDGDGGRSIQGQWDECAKCWGSGIYSQTWIILSRWRIGDRIFHEPRERTRQRLNTTIHGRIKHPDMGWKASAARWLLFTVFKPDYVRRRIRSKFWCGWHNYELWKHDVMRWRDPEGYLRNYDQIPF